MLTDSPASRTAHPRIPSARENHDDPGEQIFGEKRRRHLESDVGVTPDIVVSRWIDPDATSRQEDTMAPADRYVIAVALKTTRLKLTRGSQTLFDGTMPAGTLHVTSPAKRTRAHFRAPFDFLHLDVPADFFRMHRACARLVGDDVTDLVVLRESLTGQLAKTLIDRRNADDPAFTRCIAQTLAIHVARLEDPRSKINALPEWRLRRVEDYICANLHRSVSLLDLSQVAGLSRMHFAAQFRTATGYRPREYLLHQRVERAKSILSETDLALAEVALAVGFCTQAHFSTIFKRVTTDTPARWRSANKRAAAAKCASVANFDSDELKARAA